MYVQAGDLSQIKIDGEASIYGGEFADESFEVKHTEVGLVGMCKKKGYHHTNESQFYITTGAPLSFMDNKYVVFGRVVQGMRALKMVEKLDCINEKPQKSVIVKAGGEFVLDAKK